ncbi:MAG: TIM barrel protein [Candidatus Brocadiaceae bacterium]|jgi:hypothetical protein
MPADQSLSIGFKLPLDWRARQHRGDLPRLEREVYGFLGGLGFEFVEFSFGLELEGNEAVLELLREEASVCRAHGLGTAIHPGPSELDNLTGAWFGPVPECQPGVSPVLQAGSCAARASGGPVTVVLHPAQFAHQPELVEPSDLRREMVRRSALFFAQLERSVAGLDGAVHPVAEHQLPTDPDEPLMRIGDTCEELLQAAAHTRLGLCWDTGHYLLGVERYGQEQPPPERFLRRVTHVHLHDVVEGRDHQPITSEAEHLRTLLGALRGVGFSGGVTLEYAPEGLMAGGGVQPVLRDSVATLSCWLG